MVIVLPSSSPALLTRRAMVQGTVGGVLVRQSMLGASTRRTQPKKSP